MASEYIAAIQRAIAKRDRIIDREGDANGQRFALWYLEMLIQEEIEQETAIQTFNGSINQFRSQVVLEV